MNNDVRLSGNNIESGDEERTIVEIVSDTIMEIPDDVDYIDVSDSSGTSGRSAQKSQDEDILKGFRFPDEAKPSPMPEPSVSSPGHGYDYPVILQEQGNKTPKPVSDDPLAGFFSNDPSFGKSFDGNESADEPIQSTNSTPLSNNLQPSMTLRDGRYTIIKHVGVGGFGVVYKARDNKLNIDVAIKELFPPGLVNRAPGEKKVIIYGKENAFQFSYLKDRFLLEARSTAKFNSVKNIVDIFDCFEENNTAYLVMEFIAGKTLDDIVRDSGGKLDVETANGIIVDVLNGLSVIHDKGIIHRDIKPSNIKLTEDNVIKIIDFGAARFSSNEEKVVTRYSKVLTPGFAPPEQYKQDSKQGPYTDLYAVGALYYYLVTGIIPEESTDRQENDSLVPLEDAVEEVPDCVCRSIGRALELNTELRLQSAQEMKNGILGKKIRTVKEEKKMRFRRRAIIVASVALALCIAAALVIIDKVNKSKILTIDKLIDDDTTISVLVPTSSNTLIAEGQLTAWDNAVQGFHDYVQENSEHEISISVEYQNNVTYDDGLKKKLDTDKAPTIYYSPTPLTEAAQLQYIDRLIDEETSMLAPMYAENGADNSSYIFAYDPTVLYVNRKLLSTVDKKAKAEDFKSISDILKIKTDDDINILCVNEDDIEYYQNIQKFEEPVSMVTPAELYCMGQTVFYIGHISEQATIDEMLPGFNVMVQAPDIEGIRAKAYQWYIKADCTDNEKNAAQLFMAYITGEDIQDAMFVQTGYMVPVNPVAMEKYVEYNPNAGFISDNKDGLYFVESTEE